MADVLLRRKQEWWEHPRNFAFLIGTIVAASAAISGWLGYSIARNTPPSQTIILQLPPGTAQLAPPK